MAFHLIVNGDNNTKNSEVVAEKYLLVAQNSLLGGGKIGLFIQKIGHFHFNKIPFIDK